MAQVIKNSDPQAMHDMAKAIRRYADELSKDLQRLANKHAAMHAYWSGEQYDRFTEIIKTVKSDLEKQAAGLSGIAADVEKDAQALAAAQNIALRM